MITRGSTWLRHVSLATRRSPIALVVVLHKETWQRATLGSPIFVLDYLDTSFVFGVVRLVHLYDINNITNNRADT